LDDPGSCEGNNGSSADVDVPWKDASEINASSDSITANILEEDGKSEGKS
jgi:hypothetical protein